MKLRLSEMQATRVVFEKGIELVSADGQWIATTAEKPLSFHSLEEATNGLKPNRIVSADLIPTKIGRHSVVLATAGGILGSFAPDSDLPASATMTEIFARHNFAYLVDEIKYHCMRMADLYVEIVKRYLVLSKTPGYRRHSQFVQFGYQAEPYYELDALLTAARSAYDSTRYILWNELAHKAGTMPRSLGALLRNRDSLPADVHSAFSESWKNYGIWLTQYRDCISHYVPVDFPFASIQLECLESGIWTALARIPDNPDAKSKEAFKFEKNIDALSYSWGLTVEINSLAIYLSECLKRKAAT